MKKLFITILLLASIPVILQADPAKKINLSYASGKLKVEAIHGTKDVSKHYIDQVIVLVDGKEVKTIKLQKQTNAQAAILEIELPGIKAGSTIEVKTHCNEFGNKSAKIKI